MGLGLPWDLGDAFFPSWNVCSLVPTLCWPLVCSRHVGWGAGGCMHFGPRLTRPWSPCGPHVAPALPVPVLGHPPSLCFLRRSRISQEVTEAVLLSAWLPERCVPASLCQGCEGSSHDPAGSLLPFVLCPGRCLGASARKPRPAGLTYTSGLPEASGGSPLLVGDGWQS